MIVPEPDRPSGTEVANIHGRPRRKEGALQELSGGWEPSELSSDGRPPELDGVARSELSETTRGNRS